MNAFDPAIYKNCFFISIKSLFFKLLDSNFKSIILLLKFYIIIFKQRHPTVE